MKRVLVGIAIVAIALIVWLGLGRDRGHARRPDGTALVDPASHPGAVTTRQGSARVRRLTPEERRQLGERIAEAVRRAGAATTSHAGAGAKGNDPVIPLDEVAHPLQDALGAAIEPLAACYERAGKAKSTAVAMMTMTSDAELGTVIDTDGINDSDGKPIDPGIEECLRDTIDSLALPPLGQTGRLQLQYSFRFDH